MAFRISPRRRRTATAPPPGTYDPTYLAQIRQGQRAYDDYQQDYGVGKTRAEDDYLSAISELTTGRDQNLQDLETGRGRNLSDLLRSRTRATEDFGLATSDIARRYQQLGDKQMQSARRANVEGPGILRQSLEARQANQGRDQAGLGRNLARFMEDSQLSESRLGEDFTRQSSRVGADTSRQADRLSLALERAYGVGGDQTIGLARAGRNQEALRQDLTGQMWYDAVRNGYAPPRRRRLTIV